MHIGSVIALLVRSKRAKVLNIDGLFHLCFQTQKKFLGNRYINNVAGKFFYDPKYPAGFGSVAKLANAFKTNKRIVNEWLSGQNTYTLHKPVRKRFPRNTYTVTNIDDVWEMYLDDVSSLSKYNEKYRYLLNVIDIFSRYACSDPVKDKTGTSIKAALNYLFRDRKPITILYNQIKVQSV